MYVALSEKIAMTAIESLHAQYSICRPGIKLGYTMIRLFITFSVNR